MNNKSGALLGETLTLIRNLGGVLSNPEVSSAVQAAQAYELQSQMYQAVNEDKVIEYKGITAQIKSAKSLEDLREQLALLQQATNALLKHSLEQANRQAIANLERDKVDAERFRVNTNFTKMAAWTGVISMAIGIAAWVNSWR